MIDLDEDLIKPHKVRRVFARIGILTLTFLIMLVLFAFGILYIMCKGPSVSARDTFVMSCMETSFAKYFPPIMLSDEEIDNIIKQNAVIPLDEITDANADFTENLTQDEEQPPIEVIDVYGDTFKGKALIVKDPSRIVVGTPNAYGESAHGLKLQEMIDKENGVAGINAGGFVDISGTGTGGIPIGIVIKDSELLFGSLTEKSLVMGFDDKNVFIVGSMTGSEALEKNMRDAVSFGPALVVNGKPAQFVGTGGGMNPRTVIGQRADGSVLLVVIDGRQPNSLGATYKDLVKLMLELGAVNAGNLDGGSSALLIYNEEELSSCSSLYGIRKLPNSFIVKGE